MEKKLENIRCRISELKDFYDSMVMIKGTIISIKKMKSKRGDGMGVLTIEDVTGICEVCLFPDVYSSSLGVMREKREVEIQGTVEGPEDDPKIIAEVIMQADEGGC